EFFDGAIWLVFVSNSQTILRMRVSDGFTETAGRFDNLSSMPSITVSLPLRRWYFHHQYGSQFAPYYQAVGFADAEFESSLPAVGPAIVKQPRDRTVGASGTAVFTVVARGTGPLQYQWLVDGAPLAGATNSTLTLTQLSTDQSARYSVQIVNTAGS